MNKVFGMISLGCDKNRVDGERLLGEIREHGCPVSADLGEVQVLVVNTCAFLNAAREEAIRTVIESDLYRTGRLEKIVVTGCLPERFIGELFPSLTEGDVFLGIDDATMLFPALERAYAGERVNAVGQGGMTAAPRVITTPEQYKYLKIAEGCSNHCTYCLIPSIRGKYRSAPMEELVAEARSLGNTDELILVAQDTTRYGEDSGENQFVPLIQKLSELDNICHIRLLYCYPDRISNDLIEEFTRNKKLIPYLDIPLQHSEDGILKRMGRRGSRQEYLDLIARLRDRVPGIALRTTFITGFPGETEEEHRGLCNFLRAARLTNCGVFTYSREPDTPAFRMAGQVHPSTKKRRQRELYAVQAEISRQYLADYTGKTLEVICDGVDEARSCFVGRAYFQAPEIDGCVYFTAPHAEQGKRYPVLIEKTDTYDLFGSAKEIV